MVGSEHQLSLLPGKERQRYIVSASRRTDIPAFYTPWFMERVRQGYCLVPNPFNAAQVTRVSLLPGDAACIVFWTRNPRPLLSYVQELERLGLPPVFLFTLTGYPRLLEPHRPHVAQSVACFHDLASLLGPERIVWRYDPIVLGSSTTPSFHLENFAALAARLRGTTRRVVVSFLEVYRKNRTAMRQLAAQGLELIAPLESELQALLQGLADIARDNGMRIQACAQGEGGLPPYIPAGACIDAAWLSECLGIPPISGRDSAQREHCQCAPSRDIGMYDSCVFGCRYCYATSSLERAQANRLRHSPRKESLL